MIANGTVLLLGIWIGVIVTELIRFIFDMAATHHAICDDSEWTRAHRKRIEVDRWFREVDGGDADG